MNTFNKVIEFFGNTVKTAEALEVSVQAVCFWRDGKRKLPIDKCSDIERLTNGLVTRQNLRPDDWQRIWPELAERDAANSEGIDRNAA